MSQVPARSTGNKRSSSQANGFENRRVKTALRYLSYDLASMARLLAWLEETPELNTFDNMDIEEIADGRVAEL